MQSRAVTDLQVCQLSHTALVEDAFDLAAVDVEFAGDGALAAVELGLIATSVDMNRRRGSHPLDGLGPRRA